MEKKNNEWERGTTFKAIQSCLKCIQSILELLFPPADAPVEVIVAAQERRKPRVREVIALWTEELLTLKEIEQYRRLLSEQSTAIPDWTNGPDVYLSEPIEDARLLKKTSKRDRDKSLAREKASPKETAAE